MKVETDMKVIGWMIKNRVTANTFGQTKLNM